MLKFYSTIGAGDTFIAGVLYGLFYAPTWDLAKTLSFANELAGRKVAQHGFSELSQNISPWLDPA
jgi:ketohexokinase